MYQANVREGVFMGASIVLKRRRDAANRGLSILEFVGCLSAMAGGVILGSMYFGVDVKGIVTEVVRRAERSSAAPAKSAPTPVVNSVAEPSTTQAPTNAETAPQATADEPAAVSDTPATGDQSTPGPSLAEAITLTEEQRRELTQAYWDALNESMQAEVDSRSTNVDAGGNAGLYAYLAARSDCHEKAVEAIAALSPRGVDAHVTSYGEKALDWHKEGAKLFARARDLLTDAPTAKLSGPFAQSWQSAATQHQMEEKLLGVKYRAVQLYLQHLDEKQEAANAPRGE
jgi:hypothetical protein